jgi:hypothetical protein
MVGIMNHADITAMSPSGVGGGAAPRTFQSPSGRNWVVHVFPHDAAPGMRPEHPVLRFRSGDLVLDLADYPAEWQELPDTALVELARRAQPPKLRVT